MLFFNKVFEEYYAMGYRTYLYVVDKKKFTKLKKLNVQELWTILGKEPTKWDIDERTKEVYPPYRGDILEYADGKEIVELGDAIFYKKYKIQPYDYLKKIFKNKDIQNYYNSETELMIAKPELLDAIIDVYLKRIEDNYTELLVDDSQNPKDELGYPLKPQLERLQNEIKSQLGWLKFINDSNDKWCLATSWLYAHEVFNIIHIKKMFNPKKEVLIWAAY